jgi:sugar lactone lactonase YvrE
MTQCSYELSGVNIVSEIFGGEVVAVNLDTGKYYSMLKTGAYVWSALLAHHSAEQIAASLSAKCQLDLISVRQDVQQFIATLESEGLLIRSPSDKEPLDVAPHVGDYVRPVFEVFSDMQEILLLDPVHDVDASGWPTTKL